jgi:hypothetical protein
MAEYIVDSADQTTESLIVEYRNARVGAQRSTAYVHSAITAALAAEDSFNALFVEGAPFETLATYHAAKVAPLTASLDALRAAMVAVKQSMESLNAAVPGLFPGVSQ